MQRAHRIRGPFNARVALKYLLYPGRGSCRSLALPKRRLGGASPSCSIHWVPAIALPAHTQAIEHAATQGSAEPSRFNYILAPCAMTITAWGDTTTLRNSVPPLTITNRFTIGKGMPVLFTEKVPVQSGLTV